MGFKSIKKDQDTLNKAVTIFKPNNISLFNICNTNESKMESVVKCRQEMDKANADNNLAGCKCIETDGNIVDSILE